MTHTRLLISMLAITVIFGATARSPLSAATAETETENKGAIFTPQISIPDSSFIAGTPLPVKGTTLGEWVSAVYTFFAGAMAIIATVMVMWGGIRWLTAGGNSGRINDAKDTIYSAVIALVLTFGSYLILRTINPRLVEVRDLTDLVTSITRIEQLRGDLPRRVSSVLFGNAGLTGDKNVFNAQACPSIEEMRSGIEVFLTGYYKPAYPGQNNLDAPSGGYPNFACNIGMQCSCLRDLNPVHFCRAGGLTWPPCDLAKEGLEKYERGDYCNKTASGSAPVEFGSGATPYTAAASKDCFGFGTVFTLSRSGAPRELERVFRSPWSVQDRGSDIKGRHLDLFTGTGEAARSLAVSVTGRAIMRVLQYCDKDGRCTLLQPESGGGGGGF